MPLASFQRLTGNFVFVESDEGDEGGEEDAGALPERVEQSHYRGTSNALLDLAIQANIAGILRTP